MKTFNKETFKEQIWIWETELREGMKMILKELLSIMKDSKDKVRLRQTTSKR